MERTRVLLGPVGPGLRAGSKRHRDAGKVEAREIVRENLAKHSDLPDLERTALNGKRLDKVAETAQVFESVLAVRAQAKVHAVAAATKEARDDVDLVARWEERAVGEARDDAHGDRSGVERAEPFECAMLLCRWAAWLPALVVR